jgi:hypothetical protein
MTCDRAKKENILEIKPNLDVLDPTRVILDRVAGKGDHLYAENGEFRSLPNHKRIHIHN